jgi:hypothetical protein
MATLATEDTFGNYLRYSGGVGVNTGDVVAQPSDVGRFDTFTLCSLTGAMQVFGSLDGTNFMTSPLTLEDLGAASTTGEVYVTATAAERLYRFRGTFAKIQVQQNGATAVTGATLILSKLNRQGF